MKQLGRPGAVRHMAEISCADGSGTLPLEKGGAGLFPSAFTAVYERDDNFGGDDDIDIP